MSTSTATRNLTTKTVGKGQADRMIKGRLHSAAARANGDRIAEMNAERDGLMTRTAAITYLQTHGIYAGHSRDSVIQLRQAVADHKAANPGPSRAAVTKAVNALAAELTAAGMPAEVGAQHQVHPSGPDRVAAAKAEHKLLKAWIKSGENPPRPATPNLDALNAEHAAGVTAADRRKATKATRSGRGPAAGASPEYAEAIATKKAAGNKRGPGIQVTDEQVAARVAEVRAARPDATVAQEMEITYWTAGWACSRARWVAAWEAHTAS